MFDILLQNMFCCKTKCSPPPTPLQISEHVLLQAYKYVGVLCALVAGPRGGSVANDCWLWLLSSALCRLYWMLDTCC